VQDEGEKPPWRLELEAEEREVLDGASFRVFAPEGLAVELTGWGGGDGEPTEAVSLRHEQREDRWVEVESDLEGHDEFFPDQAAIDLRDGDHEVEFAPEPRTLRVDGADVSFDFASR
jgi:hypothetical protein